MWKALSKCNVLLFTGLNWVDFQISLKGWDDIMQKKILLRIKPFLCVRKLCSNRHFTVYLLLTRPTPKMVTLCLATLSNLLSPSSTSPTDRFHMWYRDRPQAVHKTRSPQCLTYTHSQHMHSCSKDGQQVGAGTCLVPYSNPLHFPTEWLRIGLSHITCPVPTHFLHTSYRPQLIQHKYTETFQHDLWKYIDIINLKSLWCLWWWTCGRAIPRGVNRLIYVLFIWYSAGFPLLLCKMPNNVKRLWICLKLLFWGI